MSESSASSGVRSGDRPPPHPTVLGQTRPVTFSVCECEALAVNEWGISHVRPARWRGCTAARWATPPNNRLSHLPQRTFHTHLSSLFLTHVLYNISLGCSTKNRHSAPAGTVLTGTCSQAFGIDRWR